MDKQLYDFLKREDILLKFQQQFLDQKITLKILLNSTTEDINSIAKSF